MITVKTWTPTGSDPALLRLGRPVRSTIYALLTRVGFLIERRRQRRALARLDDHLLGDVGISRADAERESLRPFWW